ncbi:MAG TPA: DUF1343 domain-containing protein [Gemmatimonadaceae bacterium]|jgi:uncharacterized protein YbbC (DUF1343 family)|nr:DUF1343 domain-containing protein [Gemmatimonadaceae bacterium]
MACFFALPQNARTIAALVVLPAALGCAQTSSGTSASSGAPVSVSVSVFPGVTPGIEVLLADSMHLLRGKRVGLLTNHSGRDRSGRSTIDLLHNAPGVRLVALFAAEHGIRGAEKAGAKIESGVDSATGIPIYSLYGQTRVPTADMLKDIDVLIYDMQDVGARVYTYVWTMAAAADSSNKPFIVLDRPDPIRADRVDGGVAESGFSSFVGLHPVAMRYGLTPGELLRYLVGAGYVHADVHVVPMRGYTRSMWFEDTKLPWVNPSPNLRDMDATLVYTGTVYFEATNVSEGRGTDQPFRLAGAPWLTDAGAIAAELNAKNIPGVRFDSTTRTIEAGYKFGGQTIPMVHVTVTNRDAVNAAAVGLHMLRAIYARHPSEFQWRADRMDRLASSSRMRTAVEKEGGVEALLPTLDAESRRFQDVTRPYWLYR